MTIHDTHPFAASGQPRRPLRRFRGRLPAPVTIWATYTPRGPVGLTVSSVAVADGEPATLRRVLYVPGEPWHVAETSEGPVPFLVVLDE